MCFELSTEPNRQYQLNDLIFQKMEKHEREVTVLEIDSENIYSVGRDGNLIVWENHKLIDSKTTSVKYNLPVCEFSLESLCYDAERVYVGGVYMDSKIWIWDKKGFREETVLTHHPNSILGLAVKDNKLVCASADGVISIIEIPDWFEPQMIETDQKILQTIQADEQYVYAGGIGNKVSVFHHGDSTFVNDLIGHDANIFSLAVDERFVYSGSGEIWWGGPGSPRPSEFESAVRVWEKNNWECVMVLEGHKDNVNDILVDKENVYSVSDDGTLRIYAKEDWSQKIVVEIDQRINALAIDSDSIFLACGDYSIIQIDRDSL